MTNRVHIICHPEAGSGDGNTILKKVHSELDSFQMEYITYLTDYSTHAEVLTEQLVNRGHKKYLDYLVVVGGDGTLHEVVQTLHKNQADIPVTYVPAGTGNDFYRSWQNGLSVRGIIEIMLFSEKPVSIPIFTYNNHITKRQGVVLNNMGFGFDAEVNFRAQNLIKNSFLSKMGLGKLSYLLAVLLSLNSVRHFAVSGSIDNHQFHYDDVSLAGILNSPTLGGGINIDQLTRPKNNEIALVIYRDIKLSVIFDLLIKVLITKKTNESDNIDRYTGQKLQLKITDPIRGQVDGEDIPKKPVNIDLALSTYPFYLPN
ncbi:MAG: diacylglycerol/lipid kinase family protein [Ruoffia tabacinasalis]|uniref:diacylglycerol/lipid kinase family protein n=1 Tax=Ruoffia sp. FAM 20858 TaxID=3259516 RepID=UPI0038898AD1